MKLGLCFLLIRSMAWRQKMLKSSRSICLLVGTLFHSVPFLGLFIHHCHIHVVNGVLPNSSSCFDSAAHSMWSSLNVYTVRKTLLQWPDFIIVEFVIDKPGIQSLAHHVKVRQRWEFAFASYFIGLPRSLFVIHDAQFGICCSW
jgi:hypothetical protein